MTEPEQSGFEEASGGCTCAEMSAAAPLSRTYPADPASVAAIRAAVGAYASQIGAARSTVDAVKLAVSEAATNVVIHAYRDMDVRGLIDVEARITEGELCVSVADTGPGLRPRVDSPGLGFGLAIVTQLADAVELLQGGEGGLRVVMRFALPASATGV